MGSDRRAALFGKQLGVALDDGQQIVEVVRDAPSQLADRLHFLGLRQSLLRPPVLGGVDTDGADTDRLQVFVQDRELGQ